MSAASVTKVNLYSAAIYAALASSTVTSTGQTVVRNGLIGVSPGTACTGFPPGIVKNPLGLMSNASTAHEDAKKAYDDAAGRTNPKLLSGDLAGMTLYPGVYKSTDGLELTTGDVTLDAQGDSNAVFVFQIASTFQASNDRKVMLANSANPANVVWQIGSSATLGTGSHVAGTMIAYSSITLNTAASLQGRAIALNGAVTLDSNEIYF